MSLPTFLSLSPFSFFLYDGEQTEEKRKQNFLGGGGREGKKWSPHCLPLLLSLSLSHIPLGIDANPLFLLSPLLGFLGRRQKEGKTDVTTKIDVNCHSFQRVCADDENQERTTRNLLGLVSYTKVSAQ